MASSDVSSVTKHFSYAAEGFITTTSGSILSGATTIPLTSVSGLTTGNVFVGIIEPGLTKQQVFTGTVDVPGVQIINVVYTRGSNAAHSAGVTIVDYVTGTGHNMLSKGLLVSHNQDGTMIASLPLTTPKVTTSIGDANGNEVIKTPATTSAVNEITITNAATGNAPSISATGGDSAINLNLRGKGLAKTVNIGAGAVNIFPYDYVASGLVISPDSAGVNKNWSITLGVVVINGNPVTVAAQSANVATASKDTYVDVLDNGDGTGLLVFTSGNIVNNNAASPALASNSIRLGIIVCGAGSIAATTSINQGQEGRILPIASSIAYEVTDSLGNLICPRDPNRKLLGYRQITSNATATTIAAIVGGSQTLSCPVIIPTGRKVKITLYLSDLGNGSATQGSRASIWDGVVGSGTELQRGDTSSTTAGFGYAVTLEAVVTPSSSSKTYNGGLVQNSSGTVTAIASSASPAFIKVELV